MSTNKDSHFPGLSIAMDIDLVINLLRDVFKKDYPQIDIIEGNIRDVTWDPYKGYVLLYSLKLKNKLRDCTYKQPITAELLKKGDPVPPKPGLEECRRFQENENFWIKTPMIYLPDPRIVLYPFPSDTVLPWLIDAVDKHVMKEKLNRLLSPLKLKARNVNIELLRYTPQMRASFLYEILMEDKNTGLSSTRQFIAKTNSFKSPDRLFANAWALWQASENKIGLARPVCFMTNPPLTLQAKVEGRRLGSMVDSPVFSEVICQTARAIANFHSLSIPLNTKRRLKNEVKSVQRWSEVLTEIRPDIKVRIELFRKQVLKEIEERMRIKGPVHADFHHTNVLVEGTKVRLIDMEEMAYGDPCVDTGRFLASLRIPSLRTFGSIEGLNKERELFLEEYLKIKKEDVRDIRLFESVSLLIAAGSAFRIQRPNWKNEVYLLFEEAEKIFNASRKEKKIHMSEPKIKDTTLPLDECLRWALDETYVQTILTPHVKKSYNAELVDCKVVREQKIDSGHRIRYKISGWIGNEKWKRVIEGITSTNQKIKKAFKKPIAYFPQIETVFVESGKTQDIALHELCQFIARRVRRKAIFFTDRDDLTSRIMKEQKSDMRTEDISCLKKLKGKGFLNVVLMEVLENLKDGEGLDLLKKTWDLVKQKGRLIIVVPNEDIYTHPHQIRQFKAKTLKKMLRPFGRPKIMVEQPFKWLIMYVKKRKTNKKKLNITKERRLSVITKLCRGRVLEVGCGNGLLGKRISDRGLEVLGIDKNAEKIAEARSNYPDIQFIQSNALELSFPQHSFDTVILPEILEHLPSEVGDKIVELSWNLVKAQGRLIVSVPNENYIPHPNHVRQFDRFSLARLLSKFGKPNLVKEQPYKWLLMYVDKSG